MENNKIKACLIGFGNSGQELCRILLERKDSLHSLTACGVEIVAVATKSRGNLLNSKGLDLEILLDLAGKQPVFSDHKDLVEMNTCEIIKASDADVLIELSTLSIADGQPALSHMETAFEYGMHVITANKGPAAWNYRSLSETAAKKGLQFLFESTVLDGTPVFNMVKRTLPDCTIEGFRGILNSTTNYILGEMENGLTYDDALKKAQDQDFVEADPDLDIKGWDAAAKTAVLINVLMNGNITPLDIQREGIDGITREQIADAVRRKKRIKLVCKGYRKDGKVTGEVRPVILDLDDIFCSVNSSSSILCLHTDLMGEICIVENNSEIRQTAYGVYSDLIFLLKSMCPE